jgi:hypothetical protein
VLLVVDLEVVVVLTVDVVVVGPFFVFCEKNQNMAQFKFINYKNKTLLITDARSSKVNA